MSAFTDPQAIANYAENPPRLVPGFRDMQRMAAILLAEKMPTDGTLLVLGAGGGLELNVFGTLYPDWRFVGVDPSAPMLDLAAKIAAEHADRITYHQGYIGDAPAGPFDGATCLLTLHFLNRDDRLRTLTDLRKRLKPGAPLVVAHHSFPRGEPDQSLWMTRFAAFAISSGVPPDSALNAAREIPKRLPFLTPAEDEALLHEAGFADVSLFYAAFSFRGWVATAP